MGWSWKVPSFVHNKGQYVYIGIIEVLILKHLGCYSFHRQSCSNNCKIIYIFEIRDDLLTVNISFSVSSDAFSINLVKYVYCELTSLLRVLNHFCLLIKQFQDILHDIYIVLTPSLACLWIEVISFVFCFDRLLSLSFSTNLIQK